MSRRGLIGRDVCISDPGLPAHPDPPQNVGVHGLVQKTVHLALYRQAVGPQPGTHIMLLISQCHRLHGLEGRVLLQAQLQLLTKNKQERLRARFSHPTIEMFTKAGIQTSANKLLVHCD